MKRLFLRKMCRSVSCGISGRAGALLLILATIAAGSDTALTQETPAPEAPAAARPQPPSPAATAELEKAKAAALEQMRAGRFAEAVPFAEQGLKLAEAIYGPDAVETAVVAHNLGFLLRRADRIPEAQRNLERALAIYERARPAVHEDTRNLVGELGQIYMRAGRAEDVVDIYQRLIDRAGREGYATHIGTAHMHNNLAFVLRSLKRPDPSAVHWQQAVAIYKTQSSPEDEPYRLALDGLIDRYQSQGKSEEARMLVADALAKLQADGRGEGKAGFRFLTRLSKMEHAAGRYAEARERAAAALAIAERRPPEAAAEQVEPLNDLARAERALGHYTAAEQGYKRAIALLNKPADAANAGILTDNLASLYGQIDRFDEAETHHKRALQLLETALGRDHREVGQAAANFGVMLSEASRHAEAEPLLRRGLTIAEAQSPQDPVNIAVILDNLSGLFRQTGRNDEAVAYQRRSLALFESALPPAHPSLATARNNLGRLLLDLGRYTEAETQLRRSLDVAEGLYGAGHVNVAIAAANLGETYAAMEQPAKARELLNRALRGLERGLGTNHPKLIHTLVSLGRLELADGKANLAAGIFERAVAIELANRNRFGPRVRGDHEQSAAERQAFFGLLDALWQSGGGKVAALTARALEMGQWNTMGQTALALTALGTRARASDPALSALIRERQDVAADWQATDKALIALFSESGNRDVALEKSLRERLATSEKRLASIDQDLQVKFPRYGDLAKPVPLSVNELRELLRPNEVALEYVVTPEATHLWLVSKARTRWVRLPAGQRELGKIVHALRCGLDRDEWNDDGRKNCLKLLGLPEQTKLRPRDPLPFQAERAHALFTLLFGPVQQEIAGKDLLIVASGPLTSLPFHVLVTEKPQAAPAGDGSDAPDFTRLAWLGKTNAVTMLPSLASLKSLRQYARTSQAASPFIGIGNPLLSGQSGTDRSAWSRQSCDTPVLTQRVAEITSPSSLLQLVRGGIGKVEELRRQSPLPETADELCSVAKYVGASPDTVLLGANATETRVKAMSASGRLAGARILHLATHGLLAGETEMFLASRAEPSLLLTPPETASDEDDGLLTATEVATLKLDADWVILSACNTASGDQVGAEALSGLARAFFYAGARSLLVSHWAVDSDATVNLITGAVAAMTKNPQLSQGEALRRSMLALISSGARQAHPAYWAPFIVVGSSGTAPQQTVSTQQAVSVQQTAPASRISAAQPAATQRASAASQPATSASPSATAAVAVVTPVVNVVAEIVIPPLPTKAPALLKKASAKPAASPPPAAAPQSARPARRKQSPSLKVNPYEAGEDIYSR